MASRIGILIVFLSYLVLASGTFFDLPGLVGPNHHLFNQPAADERIFQVPEQQQQQQRAHNKGDDSVVALEPGSNDQPNKHVDGIAEPEPEPKPVQEPEPIPVQEPVPAKEGLREMFYEQNCPQAERIVNKTIHKHFSQDPTYAAAFVRLFFHDCFVVGCDASILLDETPEHEEVEKKALQNGPFVRGFQVVDDIKKELEIECPNVVSCADILAFATRDSLVYAGMPTYNVAGGRRDGRVSLATNVEGNLPFPEATAAENIQLFERKGMSLEDLIVLIGAHSIGSAHCTVVSGRFHDKQKEKDFDRGYWIKMQTLTICGSEDQEVPFDPYSQHKMDSRFYKELLTNKALVESDHNLAREPRGNNIMKKLVDDQPGWIAKFTNAIRKLGEVDVLVGDQGEIRKQCRAVN
ncbi:hypothetical protein C2S51_030030 [Perilla frutescens var. frutescens]|nr:hypothetical protein C2S51_030030 [Perilla frutescens var. frutescens]